MPSQSRRGLLLPESVLRPVRDDGDIHAFLASALPDLPVRNQQRHLADCPGGGLGVSALQPRERAARPVLRLLTARRPDHVHHDPRVIFTAIFATLAVVSLIGWRLCGLLVFLERREHARERDLLLNQLLHATGKTWQPPPAEPRELVPDRVPSEWTTSPEQEPK